MNVNPTTGAAPARPARGDHDGDADDGGASKSTVNTKGQTLGKMVNVKA